MDHSLIVRSQAEFFRTAQTKEVDFRIAQLRRLKALLKTRERELYEAIYADFGKSEYETYTTELSFLHHDINLFVRKLPKWVKKKRTGTNLVNLPARSYLLPEPLGVCLVIGAWNYPFQLSLLPLVAAMAAGNTVVLKPSELSPASGAALARLINDNFPPEYLRVVEGGIPETQELLKHKFDKIFFTGSSAVGRIVYQEAAKTLTPVTLELGGKSPAVVCRDCNLEVAARRLVWAKFLNSGQTCIAPDYVLVDEQVRDMFVDRLKEYIHRFDYRFENHNYVRIINDVHFQRLSEMINGTKVSHGGVTDALNRFIAPTILTDVTLDDPVMKHEIFGPILPVISFASLDEAIRTIKSFPKPLAFYAFTNDDQVKRRLLGEISFGGGSVNDAIMYFTNSHLPFGGVGTSGMGSYHGYAGFREFSHFKSILEKPSWPDLALRYPPNTMKKLALLRRVMHL